jgi:hypothetical protein
METPGSPAFLNWLGRMVESSDFISPASRPVLIAEMGKILDLLRQVPELRKLCFEVAREALSSCHDRVALALNDMHMHIIDYRAGKGEYNQTQLLDLGQGFYRLHLLDLIILNNIAEIQIRINGEANWTAAQKREALSKIEEIEIKLVYQTCLKEPLNLPIQTQNMLHRGSAPVEDDEIEGACENILEQEAADNYRGFIDFLVDWVPWKNHIVRTNPIVKGCIEQLTETINEASYASLESSTQSSEQGNMTEQEYREEIARVQKSREQQLRNLLLMVTATAVSVRKP